MIRENGIVPPAPNWKPSHDYQLVAEYAQMQRELRRASPLGTLKAGYEDFPFLANKRVD